MSLRLSCRCFFALWHFQKLTPSHYTFTALRRRLTAPARWTRIRIDNISSPGTTVIWVVVRAEAISQRKCHALYCCKCWNDEGQMCWSGEKWFSEKKNTCVSETVCVLSMRSYFVLICVTQPWAPTHTPTHTRTHTFHLPSPFVFCSPLKSDFSLNSNYISPVIYSSY